MASKDRFATVVTKEINASYSKQNTKENLADNKNAWAYGIWNSWCKTRNISDELTQMTASRMDDVSQFITEAKRQDSEVYPPKPLFQIIASLQCRKCKPEIAIIINHPTFDITRKTLVAKMKALTSF